MVDLGFLIESVIDPTRNSLDLKIFDETKDGYRLKTYVKKQLSDLLNDIDSNIIDINTAYIKGSILSKQWLDWSDVDILLEVDENISDDEWESLMNQVEEKYKNAKIGGSDHPIEIFINRGKFDQDRADGLYNIKTDEWVKGPYDVSIDPKKYMKAFEKKAKKFDIELGKLKRYVIDYMILQSVSSDEMSAMSDTMKDKINDINQEIDILMDMRDDIKAIRRKSFEKGMSPEEIEEYGGKLKLPGNVIQKMLELRVLETLEKVGILIRLIVLMMWAMLLPL
jgi:hypothetical protein